MKILVTGGLGFIGSNLINILKDKYFIINIDKVSYASNFKNIEPNIKNYKFYKKDDSNLFYISHLDKKMFDPDNKLDDYLYGSSGL